MTRNNWIFIIAVVVLIAGGWWYFSQSLGSSVGVNNVTTANGFVFTLPQAWSVANTSVEVGEYQVITLSNSSNAQTIQVECPPIPKGHIGDALISSQDRLLVHGGVDYTVSYQEWSYKNAYGQPTSQTPYRLLTFIYKGPVVQVPNADCLVSAVTSASALDSQTIEAVKEISDSWK